MPSARGAAARERDRLAWLFLQSNPQLFAGQRFRILHVAPEPQLADFFRHRVDGGYYSADLMRGDVDLRLDVSALPFAAASLDAVYCSHVLQDVPDDRKALAEFYRALRPGGWAIVNIPLHADHTRENPRPAMCADATTSARMNTSGNTVTTTCSDCRTSVSRPKSRGRRNWRATSGSAGASALTVPEPASFTVRSSPVTTAVSSPNLPRAH